MGGALFSNEPIKVAVILLGVTVRTSSYLEISNSDMIKENFSSASFGWLARSRGTSKVSTTNSLGTNLEPLGLEPPNFHSRNMPEPQLNDQESGESWIYSLNILRQPPNWKVLGPFVPCGQVVLWAGHSQVPPATPFQGCGLRPPGESDLGVRYYTLTNGRCFQFRYLKWPLNNGIK